ALLERAKLDEAHPLPVVLNLSSWAQHRGTLLEWVVKELELRYLIPRRLGEHWLKEGRFLFLLDGLDEVAPSAHTTCVEAINAYHAGHFASSVVCSRQEEYLTQSQQLTLQSAVIVQPLTLEQ